MKKANLRVLLYAPKTERFCRLTAHIKKGSAINKKYIQSDITATGSELNKFAPDGSLREGANAPQWLIEEVKQFHTCCIKVASLYDLNGTLIDTPSRVLTDRVRQMLFENKTDKALRT